MLPPSCRTVRRRAGSFSRHAGRYGAAPEASVAMPYASGTAPEASGGRLTDPAPCLMLPPSRRTVRRRAGSCGLHAGRVRLHAGCVRGHAESLRRSPYEPGLVPLCVGTRGLLSLPSSGLCCPCGTPRGLRADHCGDVTWPPGSLTSWRGGPTVSGATHLAAEETHLAARETDLLARYLSGTPGDLAQGEGISPSPWVTRRCGEVTRPDPRRACLVAR